MPPTSYSRCDRQATDGSSQAERIDRAAGASHEAARTGTGTYRVQFELPAGDYIMRAAVREPGGLVGTADRRFAVRALDAPSVVSGDLLLTTNRGELPVRPLAYTGDGLTGALQLYARTAEQLTQARVVVELAADRRDRGMVSGFAELQEVEPDRTRRSARMRGSSCRCRPLRQDCTWHARA